MLLDLRCSFPNLFVYLLKLVLCPYYPGPGFLFYFSGADSRPRIVNAGAEGFVGWTCTVPAIL